jgi:hypothetical protein
MPDVGHFKRDIAKEPRSAGNGTGLFVRFYRIHSRQAGRRLAEESLNAASSSDETAPEE